MWSPPSLYWPRLPLSHSRSLADEKTRSQSVPNRPRTRPPEMSIGSSRGRFGPVPRLSCQRRTKNPVKNYLCANACSAGHLNDLLSQEPPSISSLAREPGAISRTIVVKPIRSARAHRQAGHLKQQVILAARATDSRGAWTRHLRHDSLHAVAGARTAGRGVVRVHRGGRLVLHEAGSNGPSWSRHARRTLRIGRR